LLGSLRAHTALAHDIKLHRQLLPASAVRSPVAELAYDSLRVNQMVTELHRISEQIRQAAEDNAHDLKTPLAVIRVALKRIRRDLPNNSEKIKSALEAADQSVERMFLSINVAQALQDECASLMVTPRWRADLTLAVDKAIRQFATPIGRKRLRLTTRLDEGVWVGTGRDMLQALLRNVVGNAVEASPDGGEIVVILSSEDGEAILEVEDEGSNISSDFVEQLFARDRSDIAGVERPERSGPDEGRAGYFIAKRNANLLGGDLIISNRQAGKGLSITTRLPAF